MFKEKIKNQPRKRHVIENKFQMLMSEEEARNGVIVKVLKIKTKHFKCDPNRSIWDFSISNLQSIGALGQLKTSMLTPSLEQVAAQAETANKVMEQIDIIREIENGQQTETQN